MMGRPTRVVISRAMDPEDLLPKYSSNINFISDLKVEAMDIGNSSTFGEVSLRSLRFPQGPSPPLVC
jgi:hypothetical protein